MGKWVYLFLFFFFSLSAMQAPKGKEKELSRAVTLRKKFEHQLLHQQQKKLEKLEPYGGLYRVPKSGELPYTKAVLMNNTYYSWLSKQSDCLKNGVLENLLRIIENNDPVIMKQLFAHIAAAILAGADPNTSLEKDSVNAHYFGTCALSTALFFNHIPLITFLLNHGAHPNPPCDKNNHYPVVHFIKSVKAAKLILNAGGSVRVPEYESQEISVFDAILSRLFETKDIPLSEFPEYRKQEIKLDSVLCIFFVRSKPFRHLSFCS